MQHLLQWSRRHNITDYFSSVRQRISEGKLRFEPMVGAPKLGLARLGILFSVLLALLVFSTGVHSETHSLRKDLYQLRVAKSKAHLTQEQLYLQINKRTKLTALYESAIELEYTPNVELIRLSGVAQ